MWDKEFEITFKKIMIKEVFKLIINLVLKEKCFYPFSGNKDRTKLKLDILGINQNRFSYINNL